MASAAQQEGRAAGFCSLLLLHPVKYPKFQGKKKGENQTPAVHNTIVKALILNLF